jgi:hypothetical protein
MGYACFSLLTHWSVAGSLSLGVRRRRAGATLFFGKQYPMRAYLTLWKLQLLIAVIAVIISIFLMTTLHNAQLKAITERYNAQLMAMTERHNAQLMAMTQRHNAQLVVEAERCKDRLAEQAARYNAQLVERSAETREAAGGTGSR